MINNPWQTATLEVRRKTPRYAIIGHLEGLNNQT